MHHNNKLSLMILGVLTLTTLCSFQQKAFAQTQEQNLPSDQFYIYPSKPNAIDPQAFIYEVIPGEQIEDTATIKNEGEKRQFKIYGADGAKTNTGRFTVKTLDQEQTEVGRWFNIAQFDYDLEKEESREIPFTIRVPEKTPYGEYEGGIIIQTERPSESNPNLTLSFRVAKKIIIKVTDNPQEIPRLVQANIFNSTTPYFWISIGIFAASMAYFIYAKKSEKNAKLKKSQKE